MNQGSEIILKNINKKTDLETVQKTTRLARKFGFQIRYYMITGCRGETAETIKQSEDFVKSAKPCQVIFNPFTLLPGTKEFQIAKQNNLVDENIFFTDDFFELSPLLFKNRDKETEKIYEWAVKNSGLKNISEYSLEERKEIFPFFLTTTLPILTLQKPIITKEITKKLKSLYVKPSKEIIPLRE